MLKGKSLILDIGTDSIKAVEVTKTTDRIVLSESLTINEAKRFISMYGIENMDGLINCIVENLEAHEITAKNVYIVSSALGIESKLEVVADTDKRTPKDEKNNTIITDRQVYGTLTYDDRITTASIVSSADIYTLRSLAEAFDARGYQVISIEDSLTAVMNLVKLHRYTFDYPGKVIISFGGTTRYVCYSKDCPVSINEFEAKISDMIQRIAESTNMSYSEINTLFFKYGLILSDQAVREIMQRGLDPNEYFATVRNCCLSYIQQFREVVEAECESRAMGRCYIIVTGGYADVPGLYDVLEHEFADEFKVLLRNAIPLSFENEFLLIQNKTGRTDLGAVYGTATGVILKEMFKNSVNLLPKYVKADNQESLTKVFRGTLIASVAICAVALVFLLINGVQYMLTPKVQDGSDSLTTQYSSLQSQVKALDQQLSTIENLDKTGKDIVALCTEAASGMLTITSVDTAEVLLTTSASVDEEGTATTPENSTETTEGDTEATTEETPEEPAEKPAFDEGDYVIRGFAADPSYVTRFYNRVLSSGYIGKAAMRDGIRTVELGSGEPLYIFEIVIKQ